MRWCWENFQCRGVLLIWIRVGQGPTALAVGAGGGCLDIFSLVYHFSFLSPSLWETARYRLKYCLKGPLSPKQPTNQFGHVLESRSRLQLLSLDLCFYTLKMALAWGWGIRAPLDTCSSFFQYLLTFDIYLSGMSLKERQTDTINTFNIV